MGSAHRTARPSSSGCEPPAASLSSHHVHRPAVDRWFPAGARDRRQPAPTPDDRERESRRRRELRERTASAIGLRRDRARTVRCRRPYRWCNPAMRYSSGNHPSAASSSAKTGLSASTRSGVEDMAAVKSGCFTHEPAYCWSVHEKAKGPLARMVSEVAHGAPCYLSFDCLASGAQDLSFAVSGRTPSRSMNQAPDAAGRLRGSCRMPGSARYSGRRRRSNRRKPKRRRHASGRNRRLAGRRRAAEIADDRDDQVPRLQVLDEPEPFLAREKAAGLAGESRRSSVGGTTAGARPRGEPQNRISGPSA